jgi:predicted Zn-dependent protease
MLVAGALAELATCFDDPPIQTKTATATPRAPAPGDPVDSLLMASFERGWLKSGHSPDSAAVWVLDDSSVNAVSLGDHRFVLWRGLASLPDSALDGVIAHEMAHDAAQHSRKASELQDVTDFIGEAVGVLGHAEPQATEALKRWSGKLVIPTYSRHQELQADSVGAELLKREGYRSGTAVMCVALQQVYARVGESGGGMFSNHPAMSERAGILCRGHADLGAVRVQSRAAVALP